MKTVFDQATDYFGQSAELDVPALRILTDREIESCGKLEQLPTSNRSLSGLLGDPRAPDLIRDYTSSVGATDALSARIRSNSVSTRTRTCRAICVFSSFFASEFTV